MIPKKIHYCWFGGNPLPEETKIYIESWKKYCPDYEIIEWNEKNFDLNCNIYIQEAYQAKKWAFITYYVRLYVMYNYGGIYMDTDVEVIKSLDPYLNNKAFSGFETFTDIPTGIMASEKGFPLFKEFLDYYKDRHFIMNDGSYDMTTNVVIITNICKKYGLKRNNTKQTIQGFTLYPSDYFCPKSHTTHKITLTDNTVTIHHFAGSWLSGEARKRTDLLNNLCKRYGYDFGSFLFNTIYLPYRLISNIKENGFRKSFNKIVNKKR